MMRITLSDFTVEEIKELDKVQAELTEYNQKLAQKIPVDIPVISASLMAKNHHYRGLLMIKSCQIIVP